MNNTIDPTRFDPEIVRQLGRIDLIANVIVEGVRHGLNKNRAHGFSTEFSDCKPYCLGDDPRLLDWRLYARTDRLFIKRFEAETSLEVMLILDASKSMSWRWKEEISKLEYAVNLLAALGGLHMKQQDQVGLLVHDAEKFHHLAPRCRRAQLNAIFAILEDVRPGSAETFPALVSSLAQIKRHRGIVIACTDLEEEEHHLEEALHMLAGTENEVILFHILDKAELDLPFDAATHLQDSETQAIIPVNLERFKTDYLANVERFRSHWREQCENCKITYLPIHTGMSYVDTIHAMLDARFC